MAHMHARMSLVSEYMSRAGTRQLTTAGVNRAGCLAAHACIKYTAGVFFFLDFFFKKKKQGRSGRDGMCDMRNANVKLMPLVDSCGSLVTNFGSPARHRHGSRMREGVERLGLLTSELEE